MPPAFTTGITYWGDWDCSHMIMLFAYTSKGVGVSLITASLVWGGWALFRQYERLSRDG